MTLRIPTVALAALAAVALLSCSNFQKQLKSKDYEMKYTEAVKYFEAEDWFRSEALLNDIIPVFRGSDKARDITFKFAYCQYHLGDNILAINQFRNFIRTWPNDPQVEEAEFMVICCLYEESPRYNLDQTYSLKALEGITAFENRYPTSPRLEEAIEMRKSLEKRVMRKSFSDARLYYQLKNYKSAVIALKNSLKDFPESEHREEAMFLVVKSSYLLARNSVEEHMMERYQDTINEYYAYIDEFPSHEHAKEAERIYAQCVKAIKSTGKSTDTETVE